MYHSYSRGSTSKWRNAGISPWPLLSSCLRPLEMSSRLMASNAVYMLMKPKVMFPTLTVEFYSNSLFYISTWILISNSKTACPKLGSWYFSLLWLVPSQSPPYWERQFHLCKWLWVKTLKTWLIPFFSSHPYMQLISKSYWLCLQNISKFYSCSITSMATIHGLSHYGLMMSVNFPGVSLLPP